MNYSPVIAPKNSFRCLIGNGFSSLSLILFLLPLLVLTSCASQQRSESTTIASEQAAPLSTPSPLRAGGDQNLTQRLDALFATPQFANARWGMAVIRLKDGKLLYERNGNNLFTPASNMKVYTTAVALDLLGADYRWRTSVYAEAKPDAAGNINGDLVLYGRGAPDFVSSTSSDNTNSLESLAQTLVDGGVKHVRGNIVGDASYFRGQPIGDGWQWNDLQWYYGAEASALTINGNQVEIGITSATKSGGKPVVAIRDDDGYFAVNNNLATTERGSRYQIGVHKSPADNTVTVWGDVPIGAPGYGANLSVHNPALWAARLFAKILSAKGVRVSGSAASRDSRVPEDQRFNPDAKTELAFVESKSLGEIVRSTNKYSINLYAELILRTLGRVRSTSKPASEKASRELGDEETGAALVRNWVSRAGATTTIAIHDGSGLSRLDLVTPMTTAQLLLGIQRTAVASVFLESLPIAGTDGTLNDRLASLSGKIRAKTGALIYDHSLSGYALTAEGDWLAFSIMSNDSVGKGGVIPLIDQLATALAEASNLPRSKPSAEKH